VEAYYPDDSIGGKRPQVTTNSGEIWHNMLRRSLPWWSCALAPSPQRRLFHGNHRLVDLLGGGGFEQTVLEEVAVVHATDVRQ